MYTQGHTLILARAAASASAQSTRARPCTHLHTRTLAYARTHPRSHGVLANNVFRHQRPGSICKCRFVSRPHNISGFEDCWGIAAKFELEDLFQLVIPSSCCDEPLKQQLWIDLYCFILDFDSRCTECDSLVFFS